MNELKNSLIGLSGKEDSEEFPSELKADSECAQIQMTIHSVEALEEATRIIEEFGIQVLDTKSIAPDQVLLRLNAEDMREVVLKLTENGFSGLKGINALSFKK